MKLRNLKQHNIMFDVYMYMTVLQELYKREYNDNLTGTVYTQIHT